MYTHARTSTHTHAHTHTHSLTLSLSLSLSLSLPLPPLNRTSWDLSVTWYITTRTTRCKDCSAGSPIYGNPSIEPTTVFVGRLARRLLDHFAIVSASMSVTWFKPGFSMKSAETVYSVGIGEQIWQLDCTSNWIRLFFGDSIKGACGSSVEERMVTAFR